MVYLISVTPCAEQTILYCARVSSSNPKSEDTRLIGYLIRNKHWSPFELAHMMVEITTSRAIAQQILRHKSFSFQEFSQRYAQPTGFVRYSARRQAEKDRQSSIDDLSPAIIERFNCMQEDVERLAMEHYNAALELGIAKECARFLLPLSTNTTLYMSGSIRSWIHYFDLRTSEHTQLEHREIALEIKEIFDCQFPIIAEALNGSK